MRAGVLRRGSRTMPGQPSWTARRNAYEVKITGPDFKPRHKLELAGIPSRARISPDGR